MPGSDLGRILRGQYFDINKPSTQGDEMNEHKNLDHFLVLSRLLMAAIFIWAGLGKISGSAGTQAFMASKGLPAVELLFYLTVALEVLGGLALIVGYRTTWVAAALAAFTLLTAVVFHTQFDDRNQMVHFMKNLAIVGGLLHIMVMGPGRVSMDASRARKHAEHSHS